jgi:hypothetical protein
MRSVADDLRDETRRKILAMSPAERMSTALRLGDDDVTRLAGVRQISVEEARGIIRRQRRVGRRPSVANDD